jgi:hypothetical protein
MTRDDVIRMAREAGFQDGWLNLWAANFEQFANLIAVAEREACADVCKTLSEEWYSRSSRNQHHIGAATGQTNAPTPSARETKENDHEQST